MHKDRKIEKIPLLLKKNEYETKQEKKYYSLSHH